MPSTPTKTSSMSVPVAHKLDTAQKNDSLAGTSKTRNVLYFLIAFRLLNALTIRTFFQPDEYYQSLEPAWWLAFGDGSGSWITWEWKQHLRSALHPVLFAIVYRASDAVCQILHVSATTRSEALLAAPKALQAVIAAFGDYYTYKLAKQIYGRTSNQAWLTLFLSVTSAWQWFCSTRTFSNCLETPLTIVALYNWPFHWALGTDEVGFQVDEKVLRIRQVDDPARSEADETTRLRRAILCAATAVILRPTNAIIWITLTLMTFVRGMWHHHIHWEITAFLKEGVLCGSTVLTLSALVDRLFYGVWTFPPWSFLKFNVFQSLAVFYGNNNWHYYLTQGYPLLLTVAAIWAGMGVYEALTRGERLKCLTIQSRLTLHRLAVISLVLPAALSVLSHKEVRFIYPVLPALHILAALSLAKVVGLTSTIGQDEKTSPKRIGRRGWAVLIVYLIVNVTVAGYTSLIHGSGVVDVTNYLRQEFETHYLSAPDAARTNLTFAAFMPCHSIPWRSHLHYPPTSQQPGISGWALTCEPPLNLDSEAKASYLDE
ncbi:glycosylphosphatidylinositol anchor biosynthesis, partial [Neophaeococcomyces mojaviensis]